MGALRILLIIAMAAIAGAFGALVTRADAAPAPAYAAPAVGKATAYPASMTLTIARGVSTSSAPCRGSAATP